MKFIQTQTSCNSGQLSRSLEGRFDIQEYKQGCRELTNMLVMKEGGVTKLPGIQAEPGKDPTDLFTYGVVHHSSFHTFSNGKEFLIIWKHVQIGPNFRLTASIYDHVFGNFDNHTFVLDTANVIDITKSLSSQISICQVNDTIVFTYTSGLQKQEAIEYDAVAGTFYSTADAFNFSGNRNTFWSERGGWLSSAVVPLNLPSNVRLVKSGTTFSLSDPAYNIVDYVEGSDTYFYFVGTITLTGVMSIHGYYAKITAIGATSITATPMFSTIPDGSYDEFYFPIEGVYGYPRYCTTKDDRLILGSFGSKSMTIVGSSVENKYVFANKRLVDIGGNSRLIHSYSGNIQNIDPFLFSLGSYNGEAMRFLISSTSVYVGSTEGLSIVKGTDGGILGPLNVDVNREVTTKCDGESIVVNDVVYMLTDNRTNMWAVRSNSVNGTTLKKNISILSSDLYKDNDFYTFKYIQDISVLLVLGRTKTLGISLLQDGQLFAHFNAPVFNTHPAIALEYVPSLQKLIAFTKYGVSYYNYKDNNEWDYADVHVQLTGPTYIVGDAVAAFPTFVEDDVVNVIVHRAGVEILREQHTVTNLGTVNLSEPILDTDTVYVYSNTGVSATVCLLPVEAGQQFGSAQYAIKKVDTVGVRLLDSYSFKIKEYSSNFEDEHGVSETPSEPFTGVKFVKLDARPSTEQVICISNNRPEPFTVTGITLRGQANDG